MTGPFWEAAYQDIASASAFGAPSEEIRALLPKLPAAARVLDLGCGDGRNTLFLLEQGCEVTAVDVSTAAVTKLTAQARESPSLHAVVQDARHYRFAGPFDLVIAHGLLHLMPRADWAGVIGRMQAATAPLGYNVVAVFTDQLPAPADLERFMLGLFGEGELLACYHGWRIEYSRSYVLEDEHPGGLRHRHPINKIVAQRPG